MEHLSNDHNDHPNHHKNSHKLDDENGASRCEFDGKSMETETTTWSEFLNETKAKALASEERKRSKSAGL